MTKEYLAEPALEKETDFQKVFLIFKFAITPEPMIEQFVNEIEDLAKARSYFKKIALNVHPDKNKHVQANEVFQKVARALEYIAMQQT